MDELINKLGVYAYIVLLGAFGGLLAVFQKHKLANCKTKKCYLFTSFFGVLTSIFIAYIGYEITNYFLTNEKISLAIAGVCAWAGTDALVALEKKLINIISDKEI
ncbi:hypothetical protein YY92_08760 [Campylobacter fetus]|uniref:phage holin family protein n=1 Tax=Campylobacter fetus TaxID=196 RepID=UPI0011CBC6AF|nr:phage holin family protein [Campylobacter fetus]EAJ1232650.1 hypothetical protein [Campylobacter fetus]EAK0414800.1 hypothetical protein [Campylobacter fetus]TXF09989.1 hypothetical protein FPD25_01370 [Campylobacter fetus subsp. fetus]